MPGQPQGEFDVTNVQVLESPPDELPSILIPRAQQFLVLVDFHGNGKVWDWMDNSLFSPYLITIYIKSVGAGYEGVLATAGGNLNGAGQYSVPIPIPGGVPSGPPTPTSALAPGAYKLVATVRFPPPGPPHFGGYFEGPILMIS